MTKKAVLCRQWTVHGSCAQGANCSFAHGAQELNWLREAAAPRGVVEAEEAEQQLVPPGTEVTEMRSPPREYFDEPAPYELAYGAEEEKALLESKTLAAGAESSPWRKVEVDGAAYWYNDVTGVSQWDEPVEEEEPVVEEGGAPKNDDFDALVRAADGDLICEPIGDGVLLRVIVKPGQPEDNVLDVTPSCAKVSLRAPIEDRWCNQALLAFCRRALHVPQRERNAVKIVDGEESLDKIVHIPALSSKEVIKRLHKKKDYEVDTNDVDKWIRHTERKQREEERRMKRRKWA
ncbi:hypothetical protein CTAYLR_001531 [Chrysophaeum taylorii]|uniref:Uncharacterized protein n=1 Tax=Chrysophaeum taylorii TaxID=2483200 RepID=A0AAD7XKK7_9STRA|nr:hypothetical protein CTAYLR_001531 [Chrysophaeum taylorii]